MSEIDERIKSLLEVSENNSFQMSAMSKQMGIMTNEVQNLRVGYERHDAEIEQIKKRQKENEHITPHQRQELKICVENRVGMVLKDIGEPIPSPHYGAFARKCWSDSKRFSKVVGTGGVDTRSVDFEDCKDYIGKWTPHGWSVRGYIDYLENRKK